MRKNMKKLNKKFKPLTLRLKKVRWNSPQAMVVVALFVIAGGYLVYRSFAMSYYPLHNDEAAQMSDINDARQARGLRTLAVSPCLTQAARENTLWEVEHQSTRDIPQSMMERYCSSNWYGVYESNAGGTAGCDWPKAKDGCNKQLFNAFMNSPEHKSNILDPSLKYFGSGAYRDSTGKLWVSVGFGNWSGMSGANTNVHTTISAVSPAAGSNVKAGQKLTMAVSYNAVGSNPLNNAHLNGFIPPQTTFVSMWPGTANPKLTSSGTASNATPYDPGGLNHTYWIFNYIPGNGSAYDHDSFNYTIQVKSGLANGTKICPFATVRGGDYNGSQYQPSWDDWMPCYTVQN